ncbi:MAG TPA: tetratricopeptide repeat protein, partial [Burkholderiaceae bacterium]|nr:tetratricopeptide repeat protein [Burkholderiaceae bacterium]
DTSSSAKPDDAMWYKEQGDVHLRNGDFTAAAQSYRLAIAINPDYAKAHSNLGFALKELGSLEDAELSLKCALALDPGIADAYYILGSLSQMQGKSDAAMGYFRRALERDPDFEIVYVDLFHLLLQQGSVAEAKRLVMKGIELNPGHVDLHFFLGNLYHEEQQFNLAIDCFRRALSLQPNQPEVLANLGFVLFEKDELEPAILAFQQALAINPKLVRAYASLGSIFHKQYKFDDAITAYRTALDIDAGQVDVQNNLNAALRAKQHYEETSMLHIGFAMADRKKVRLICATRATREAFFTETPLGKSFALYKKFLPFIELQLFAENSTGLSAIYNRAIEYSKGDPANLVFIHDDVFLVDFYWAQQIDNALQKFDIVGLVGNRRRLPRQPAWCFVDENFTWDAPQNFSGVVGTGDGFPCSRIDMFDLSCQECKLLDGVMLIADSATLMRSGLRFDPRFDFHFYDMDFCRQAEIKELRMGTWPISLIHVSGGGFGGASWKAGFNSYLAKYGE